MKLAARLSKLLAAARAPRPSRGRTSVATPAMPAPLLVALEPRIVYDASAASIGAAAAAPTHAAAGLADAHATDVPRAVLDAPAGHEAAPPRDGSSPRVQHDPAPVDPAVPGQQVVFIDPHVDDYQALVAGLPPGTAHVVLDASRDGLAQIAQYLQQHPGMSAIHLVSHGSDGQVQVGSTWLNEADLSAWASQLAQIGAAMRPGGDFLIYGCDVAQHADGQDLVQRIAAATGLNVAASTDITGAASLGGDWTLEYQAGAVHTGVIFSGAAQQGFQHVLAAYDETYDAYVGFDTGGTPVSSFSLDGLTYTGDQAVESSVFSGSLPASGSGGELIVNVQGTQLGSLTIQRQDGALMAVQSFDIDVFVSDQVTVQALDASGNVIGSVNLNVASNGNSSLFHVDLSGNTAFSQVKSVRLVESGSNGAFLSPTLDNFTYLAPSSPPTLVASGGSASFVAGDNTTSTPVAVDSGIALTDGNSSTAVSATVAITGNLHTAEDRLAFTNTSAALYGNISASYNAGTGVLTLTSSGGSASIAQWQAALRAVTYTDTAVTPNPATRTVTFQVTSDGITGGNSVARSVTVADTDQTPIVTTTGGSTSYRDGASAVTIDSGITVSDLDNTTQASGAVAVAGGFSSGDTLAFTNTSASLYGNIVASFNGTTGVLTLTSAGATATDAQWAHALAAVTFSSSSPTLGNRTIAFSTNDGVKSSAVATHVVSVTTPVQVTTDGGSASFVAGDNTASTPVAVDSGLTVSDALSGTLSSATVAVTGNFHSGEDVLGFVNDGATMGNITASYDAATGVLTLTSAGATATLAQWQSALDSVTYTDTAVTPNTATRTVSFTVVDGSGNSSNTATRTVTVTDTDQTPIVSTTGGTTNYVGGTSAVTIDGGITVSDLDNTTQVSGTVSISAGFHAGDTLTFVNSSSTSFGNIVGSYNAATGVLTLTSAGGTATDAQWANALSAVTFSAGGSATPGNRTISFATSDGIKTSAVATDTVDVLAPPVLTTDGGSASFVAGDNTASTPVVVDSGLTITDGASSTLSSATVAITGNFHSGEDVLGFVNDGATMGNISASYNASTGVLTLTSSGGTATLAQWQAALRSVTYTDTAVTPNNATRTISFTAVDGAAYTSNTATRTVTVTDTDQTPIVSTTGGTTNYVGGTSAVTIDGGITVSDLDNTTQVSGTVSISAGFHAGDTLTFVNSSSTSFGNIVGSYNAATGVLALTSSGGTATDAQWANALSAVTFSAGGSATPGNRTISFATSDGTKTSAVATDTVDVLAPPVLTTDGGSASFVAGDNTTSTPVTIDAGLTVTDGASGTLSSATVAITGNFHSGEDVLGFVNDGATMGNITSSYNSATGVLTLTSAGGTATLAQWQAALRSVTYTDTAITPNNATRTISFTAVDGAAYTSNTATRTVTVTDTDQTPIVTTTGGTTNYVGGTSAVTIDGGITVSDLDNTTQVSGTVSISAGFHAGDTLTFVNSSSTSFGNIVGSYNAATGVLTLTSSGGTATDAQWANALSAVTFSAGGSATPGNRTISFATSDGTKTSAVATDTVDVLAPPVVTTDGGSASFVAGDNTASTPVVVDSGLTITDGASSTLSSATVAITGNFHSGEDVLGFVNDGATMGNITSSYNSATGVLTLTSAGGTATLAQWQAALRSVTYTDTAITPNNATRTISFTAVDGAAYTSNTATRTVTVTDTDQTPIVTTTGGTTNYVGGTSAVTIDGGITVSDLDNTTQVSGTVSISAGFHAGDTLTFVNSSSTSFGNIVGSYNAATGVLTLTSSGGTATDAQWANALSAVTFSAGGSATPGNRTISFATSDGTKTSAVATDTVDVLAPPVVTTDGGSASFVAGDNTASTPVVVDSGLTITDGASSTLSSATVAITGNFHSGEDVLGFVNDGATMGNISASYNASTGVLTLTSSGGTATLAQWQAALRSVTYTDTAITPNNATRTISFTAVDGAAYTSNTATRTVTVTDTDQTPIVSTTGGTTNYVGGTAGAPIDAGLTVSDRDDATQSSATVSIGAGFQAGDTLSFTNTGTAAFGNITASYDAATGVLTLTSAGGSATNAQWADALRAVTFSAGATAAPGSRTIAFATNDGTKTSALATDTVHVISPPILSTDPGSAAFVAGDNTASTPVAVDPGLALADAGASALASATVAITGGFQAGEDRLGFTNTSAAAFGDITASWNASTGVLTLSSSGGAATLAQWQAALAAVTYTDTAITPSTATRTITFSVVDAAGTASGTATRTVTVAATDQTPVLASSGGSDTWVVGSAGTAIDPGLTLTDRDDATQASAMVSITGGFHAGEDVLAFSNTSASAFGDISAHYDAATGVLTLTSASGTATDAQWAHALAAVTFSSTGSHVGDRTISFVSDDGTKSSAPAIATITVLDRPQVSTGDGSASFVAGDNVPSTPVAVAPGLSLDDASSGTLAGATVSITGGLHPGEDLLSFRNDGATMGDITARYDAATGVLTLTSASGQATLAQWRAALAAVTYTDTAVTPDTTARTVSFAVTDGNGTASVAQSRTVTVTATDQTPVLSVGGAPVYVSQAAGATPVAVAPDVSLSDADGTTLASAQVSITAGLDPAHDVLAFTGSAATGDIVARYDAATGVLTLTSASGHATLAQWRAALQSVTYADTRFDASGSRTLSFTVNDGVKTSAAATGTVTIVTGPSGGVPVASLPVPGPSSTPPPPSAFDPGALATAPPDVLRAFDPPPAIGAVPIVATITFQDPSAPRGTGPLDHTTVPRMDAYALDAAMSLRSDDLQARTPAISVALAPDDPFAVDVATLLPPSMAMQGAGDVTVRLADGRSLPGWIRYDAAKGVLRGRLPAGSDPVHVVVLVRDAAGHEVRREIVLQPRAPGEGSREVPHDVPHDAPHGAPPKSPAPAARAGRPSLDQQFAQARAALHVSRPGGAARRA